jgi:hypothetical protein
MKDDLPEFPDRKKLKKFYFASFAMHEDQHIAHHVFKLIK